MAEAHPDEVTLYIDGSQAMQSWERDLMCASADVLCTFGHEFLEVGLGLGISALRIAGNVTTRRHTVIEKYQEVIELFQARNAAVPEALEIVRCDFFDMLDDLVPESIDGIFFDPALPMRVWNDAPFWSEVVPKMVRLLRHGGAFVPFFSTRPVLREQYVSHFERVIVQKRRYRAFDDTMYTHGLEGDAFIQCFIRD